MNKNQQQIQKMTLASMFTALGVIMASPLFAYMIMLFGVPAVRVDLIAIPIILAGIILGPIYGLTVGIAADLLGFVLFNSVFGPYHIGFTINLAFTGFLSGLFYLAFKKITLNISLFAINVTFLSILSVVGSLYLIFTDEIIINGNPYLLTQTFKGIFIGSIILFFVILLLTMIYTRKKKDSNVKSMDQFIFIVLFIEVFVVILLTPIWVLDLYQAPPYLAGVFIRVIRAMWLIPIKAYLVYYIWYVSRVATGSLDTHIHKVEGVKHE